MTRDLGRRPRWLVLEPYFGGSHRALVEGLREHLAIDFLVWTLPPRKWKWRMRGAALHFARRWDEESPSSIDGILATSLLDAASLRGLLPRAARTLPLLVYFHENQLAYPFREWKERDLHFPWTNLQTALAADRVLWNSAHNRDSFVAALPAFLKRLPDARPRGVVEAVLGRSDVLPVPIDHRFFARAGAAGSERRGQIPRVVWNHRWEHDKGPETLFRAATRLANAGARFELSVLGERFAREPAVFARAREGLSDRIAHWGGLESRAEYAAALGAADFVVSTARHEFQGLAILEAAAAGAVPVVPDDLVYPEIWPEELRYRRGAFEEGLAKRLEEVERWREWSREGHGRVIAARYGWEALRERWEGVLRRAVAKPWRGCS